MQARQGVFKKCLEAPTELLTKNVTIKSINDHGEPIPYREYIHRVLSTKTENDFLICAPFVESNKYAIKGKVQLHVPNSFRNIYETITRERRTNKQKPISLSKFIVFFLQQDLKN